MPNTRSKTIKTRDPLPEDFDNLEEAADNATTEAGEDALENKADATREAGEVKADATRNGADADGNSAN